MNQDFFKQLIGQQVLVNYITGKKEMFINGEVMKAEKTFVTIANDEVMVSVLYPSVTFARSIASKEKAKKDDDARQQLEQQQEERRKVKLK